MAYVNTQWRADKKPATTVSDVIRSLRGAVADEMAAANLYSQIIDDLKAFAVEKGELVERLSEIQKDEENHAGSLLYLIGLLDSSIINNMEEGEKGA